MELKQRVLKTDLIFSRFEGEVYDRGEYLIIKTPSNPGYYWGNYVIFRDPPNERSFDEWVSLYREEFDYYDEIKHMTFTWDGEDGGFIDPKFKEFGFEVECVEALVAKSVVNNGKLAKDLKVRPLRTEQDWLAATKNQIATTPDPTPGFDDFKNKQMQNYRKMSDAGLGNWFGGFVDGKLVADLGIFYDGPLGRFQQVGTHPDFRRRGICSRLVYESANYAYQNYGVDELLIAADVDYHALGLYKTLGFQSEEKNYGLCWAKDRPST